MLIVCMCARASDLAAVWKGGRWQREVQVLLISSHATSRTRGASGPSLLAASIAWSALMVCRKTQPKANEGEAAARRHAQLESAQCVRRDPLCVCTLSHVCMGA
jgi:hypothetical protein